MLNRTETIVVEIGGLPVGLRTDAPDFARLLSQHYSEFVNPAATPAFEFRVELLPPGVPTGDEDVRVRQLNGSWMVERGDFHAQWNLANRRGWVRQSASPYGIDSLLRILHTVALASESGFLVHAASAIRNSRAYVFAGRSGAGKTTLARLAPPDVTLLSDEISYVRRVDDGYVAFGTPFAGELTQPGENTSAPLAALYLLEQGPAARVEPLPEAEAVRRLLQNILFFAEDAALVEKVFETACEFTRRVPVARLVFPPDARAWEAIG